MPSNWTQDKEINVANSHFFCFSFLNNMDLRDMRFPTLQKRYVLFFFRFEISNFVKEICGLFRNEISNFDKGLWFV